MAAAAKEGIGLGGEVSARFPDGLTIAGSGRYLLVHDMDGQEDWSQTLQA